MLRNQPSCNSPIHTLCCCLLVLLTSAPLLLEAQQDAQEKEDQTATTLPTGALKHLVVEGNAEDLAGIYRVLYSPNGKLLATRDADQVIRIWEVNTGKPLFSLEAHENRVSDVIFTPDSQQLISTSAQGDEGTIVWDLKSGKKVQQLDCDGRLLNLHAGKLLVIGDRKLSEFDLKTFREIRSRNLLSASTPLAISSDSAWFAETRSTHLTGVNFPIAFRDATNLTSVLMLTGLTARPVAAAFSEDKNWFVTAGRRQNHALLWNLKHRDKPLELRGHNNAIQAICFSSDGRQIATGSWDEKVRIWEVVTGKELAVLEGHHSHTCAVAFSPDGTQLSSGAAGEKDNSVLLWDSHSLLFHPQMVAGTLTAENFPSQWKLLEDQDPKQAYQAIASFKDNPQIAVEQLQNQLKDQLQPTTEADLPALIAQLDHQDFAQRESAQLRLLLLKERAETLLQKTLSETNSPEVSYRIQQILQATSSQTPTSENEKLRMHRVIYSLELIRSAEAKTLLTSISTGYSDQELMNEAAHALKRLEVPQK